MSRKDDVFALTIADLDLPILTANNLVKFVLNRTSMRSAELTQGTATITVEDVVRKVDEGGKVFYGAHRDRFMQKLVERGLSVLDWDELPKATLTPKVIKSRSKREWLDLPAIHLTNRMLIETVAGVSRHHESIRTFRVRELLALSEDPKRAAAIERDLLHLNRKGYLSLRAVLEEIGFTQKDGPFMRIEDPTKEDEKLAREYGITPSTAKLFRRIAIAKGWIS